MNNDDLTTLRVSDADRNGTLRRLHKRLLKRARGPEAELTVESLAPASKREILLRMLTNLAHIYRERGDAPRMLQILERMYVLDPENAGLERELHRLRQRASAAN